MNVRHLYDTRPYDVVIIGGSFAGLATAMPLRGYRVLVLDPYPIGSHQVSACATPWAVAKAVGAQAAIQELHHTLTLHIGHRGHTTSEFDLPEPFVTFDYGQFCQAMLAQTHAEVCQTRAVQIGEGAVVTEQGVVSTRFVVNAAGWRQAAGQPARPARTDGYALETELPLRLDNVQGLHFYIKHSLIPNGYAWVFPCGAFTRIGIASFAAGLRLRPVLAAFLDRFGLRMGQTHGGVLAINRRVPILQGVFYVGDAAGHCLPVSGEGIRTAIQHGQSCGQAIANVLSGCWSAERARSWYTQQVQRTDSFHARLHRLQPWVSRIPEPLLAGAARVCAVTSVGRRLLAQYLSSSGGLPEASRMSQDTAQCQ